MLSDQLYQFDFGLGARTSWGQSSMTYPGFELDTLNSLAIENRVMCRAIGL
jgi:hypothetical protein